MRHIIQTWNWLIRYEFRQVTQFVIDAINLEEIVFTVEVSFQSRWCNTYNTVDLRQRNSILLIAHFYHQGIADCYSGRYTNSEGCAFADFRADRYVTAQRLDLTLYYI